MLNDKLPVTLYSQLKEHIIAKIRLGEWAVDSKIPTERELCELYSVSRITVRQALDDLASEGYIYKKQGKGTFVKTKKFNQPFGSMYSFSDEIKKMGATPSSSILSFDTITPGIQIREKLGLRSEDTVFELKRLRNADGEPYALEFSYIPCSLAKGLTREDIEEKGLYRSMRECCGIEPSQALETFEAVNLSDEQVKLLKARKKAAAFLIERITYWNAFPVELCESYVRGDKYKYHILLK